MSVGHHVAWTIRSCREARGYSQEYMADMLDISQSTYANIESGKTRLSLERLFRISEILNININNLMEGIQHAQSGASVGLGHILHQREAYEELIAELRSEIDFLKSLIADYRSDRSSVFHPPQ